MPRPTMTRSSPPESRRARPTVGQPVYLAFGLFLIATLTAADLWGWGPTRVDEVKNVPRSVRDNPASYRAHYNASFGSQYSRGK